MFIVCTVDFYVVMTQYSRTSDWFAKNCILPDVSSMLTMSGLIFAKWKSASFGLFSMIPWAIRMDAVVFMYFFLKTGNAGVYHDLPVLVRELQTYFGINVVSAWHDFYTKHALACIITLSRPCKYYYQYTQAFY